MIYRIVHQQYFDEKAVQTSENWIIETLHLGLFGDKWKRLKHTAYCGWGDSVNVTTSFESQDEAREVVGRLAEGQPRSEWTETVVETVSTGHKQP